jgi:exodeoxyribonuclease VII large subunit
VRERRTRFSRTAKRLSPAPIARRQKLQADALAALTRRQDHAVSRRLDRLRGQLTQADRLLATLSHKAVLARGFALVKDAEGAVIKLAADVAPGAPLQIEFADGTTNAVATGGTGQPEAVAKPATPASKPAVTKAAPSKPKEPGNQGSLF